MTSWLRAHGFSAFLALACLALSVQVVVLGRQNRALKAAATPAAAGDPRGDVFRVGEPFFPFEYRERGGSTRRIDYAGEQGKTLLFVLADACPVCPQVVPRWEEIAPFFQDGSTRVLGVLLDQPDSEEPAWIEGVPLGSFADLARVPLARLRTVPLTVLVDARGVVEWVHYGTLSEARLGGLLAHVP